MVSFRALKSIRVATVSTTGNNNIVNSSGQVDYFLSVSINSNSPFAYPAKNLLFLE
jgi:hypothetical protein